ISYSVPEGSIDAFWKKRLADHNVPGVKATERFGQKVLQFEHPDCGIPLELIEDPTDTRKGYKSDRVPEEFAIRGFHNWTVTTREMGDMGAFLDAGWNYKEIGSDGEVTRYAVDAGASGLGKPNHIVDLRIQPNTPTGSWMYGEGFVHHGAFDVKDYEVQDKVK